MAETQELNRDEEDVAAAVPVESESYVNLRKRTVGKHSTKVDNVLQENGKLCREFAKKQVGEGLWPAASAECIFVMTSDPSLIFVFATVFHCFFLRCSRRGVSGRCWSRGGICQLGRRERTSWVCWTSARCSWSAA